MVAAAERLDPADLAAMRHYAALAQHAQAEHQSAHQRLVLAQQAAQAAERELLLARERQAGHNAYILARYAILGDSIEDDGAIVRVERRRDGDFWTPERRTLIERRLAELTAEAAK